MHRARAYKGSKLGPEKQARQNPKVGSGTGPAVRPYRNRSKCNTGGKCSICSDRVSQVPHVIKCKVDFELSILFGEAPSISKAHIRD